MCNDADDNHDDDADRMFWYGDGFQSHTRRRSTTLRRLHGYVPQLHARAQQPRDCLP